MSQEGKIPSEFAEWIIRSLDGSISDEQFAQLDHEIAVNDDARLYYLEFITTYVGLVDVVGALPTAETLMAADSVSGVEKPGTQRRTAPGIVECPTPKAPDNENTGALRIEPGATEAGQDSRNRTIRASTARRLPGPRARGPGGAGPPGRRMGLPGRHRRVAQAAQWLAATGAGLLKTATVCLITLGVLAIVGLAIYAHRTLGVLVDSANAKWAAPVDQTGELRAGRMTLEEGYARIRLKKGAEVILQAPSTFDLRTTNRMFLESGWITALVPPSATGFTVRTPTSSVTDFGTEFGLLVGDGEPGGNSRLRRQDRAQPRRRRADPPATDEG